jgi:hypothetical protein
MKSIIAGIAAGIALVIAAEAFPQKLPTKEAAARDVCISTSQTLSAQMYEAQRAQEASFAAVLTEITELKRENQELKTLLIATAR